MTFSRAGAALVRLESAYRIGKRTSESWYYRSCTEVEVHAALPGVKKEDLDVSITNQTITIRSSTKEEKKEEEKGKYFRREITRGEFQRTLSLPDNVDVTTQKHRLKMAYWKWLFQKQKKASVKPLK